MKTSSLFKKENFRFRILAQLFFRPKPVQISQSIKDLEAEVSAVEYPEKVKYLIEQDLLLRYTEETVKKGMKNFHLQITTTGPLHQQIVAEKEPFSNQPHQHEILTDEKQQEIWKVQNRIPKWFKNPDQYNSQILIAYLDLLGENNSVSLNNLEARCGKIKTFRNNYSQMKIISERNHAKVFEESGGRVTIWEPVREFVKKEYEKHLRGN